MAIKKSSKASIPSAPSPWVVLETKSATKSIAKAPEHIREAYDDWAKIVRTSGIVGLHNVQSYDDKKLAGQPKMPEERYMRSSRLSQQWRVYYQANRGIVTVNVLGVNAHEWSSPVRGTSNVRFPLPTGNERLTPYHVRVRRTPGSVVQNIRKLQFMTQASLARISDLDQATISAIEHGRIILGPSRALRLAEALRVHPSVLLWPND